MNSSLSLRENVEKYEIVTETMKKITVKIIR